MRNTILTLMVVFIGLSMSAQDIKVKAVYETTLHIEMPEGIKLDFDIPKKRVTQFKMDIKGGEMSYVQDLEYKDPNASNNGRGRRFRMGGGNSPSEVYVNTDDNLMLERVNFFRKEFLVSDTITDYKWKVIPTEQRDILGYTAMRAILQDTSKNVEAWFTPQIQASFGPEKYGGLPGLILAITIDEKRVVLAKSVDIAGVEPTLVIPTEGKKMSKTDFEKLKEKKMKEMRQNWGNSRRFRVR